jgi:hypothetical protein
MPTAAQQAAANGIQPSGAELGTVPDQRCTVPLRSTLHRVQDTIAPAVSRAQPMSAFARVFDEPFSAFLRA